MWTLGDNLFTYDFDKMRCRYKNQILKTMLSVHTPQARNKRRNARKVLSSIIYRGPLIFLSLEIASRAARGL